jgi:hypothetical protein
MNEKLKIYLLSYLLFITSVYFLYKTYAILQKINRAKVVQHRHRKNLEQAEKKSYERKEEERRLAAILDDNTIA